MLIRSEVLGFCMGVHRAVDASVKASSERGGSSSGVYTLGPLIHNQRVLDSLMKLGVKILNDGERPPSGSTVIIRAHGVSPEIEAVIREAVGECGQVLDASCPHVKASQKRAQNFSRKGFWVFLAGEKDHAEIIGIRSYAENKRCSVIADAYEAETEAEKLYKIDKNAKTVLIGQTTIKVEEYDAVGKTLKRFFPNIEVLNTICNATSERQNALADLCEKVDAVIIVGGRNSANTRHLLNLAEGLGKPAWIAESAGDIPLEISSYKTVGLCSGASAPDDLTSEIEKQLTAMIG